MPLKPVELSQLAACRCCANEVDARRAKMLLTWANSSFISRATTSKKGLLLISVASTLQSINGFAPERNARGSDRTVTPQTFT